MENKIINMLDKTCEKNKQKTAFEYIEDGMVIQVSYGSLRTQINHAIKIVENIEEKRVALLGMTSFQWICMAYAMIACGKTIIFPDATLPLEDLSVLLKNTDCERIIITDDRKDLEALNELCPVEYYSMDRVYKIIDRSVRIKAKCDNGEVIFFTSGTSKLAKGVVLTYDAIFAGVEIGIINHVPKNGERLMIPTPTYHIMGFMLTLISIKNCNIVCYARNMKTISKDMFTFNPDSMLLVPSLLDFIASSKKGIPAKTKRVMVGGGALSKETFTKARDKGLDVYTGYGLSEACGQATVSVRNDISKMRLTDNMEVKISDEGEILLKSKSLMKEYYNNKEETDKVLIDGYLHTGDVGYITEDNCLVFTGRIKDIIVMDNGEKVNCRELDDIINAFEKVREGAIKWTGKELVAVIVPQDGFCNVEEAEDYMMEQVKEYNKLQPFFRKISRVEIKNEPLKRTSTGKIQRREL
ncbi:MAG: acyl--CoA ligase [Lachnospiraceae bacterium]|nr:acyl--CoA ligase [Lachnospiraceae bacterium]